MDGGDPTSCPLVDMDGNGTVEINDLVGGVRPALLGCEVPFRVLRSASSASFAERVLPRGGVMMIYDRAGLEQAWTALPDTGYFPTVDFDQCTVAIVFDLFKPTSGYSIGVDSARQLETGLAFHATSHDLGSGCIGAEIITRPLQVLALPKFA